MAKTAVTTRLAESRDLEAVASLFDAYRQFYEKPADLALARRYLTERLQRRESVIIVAENAGGDIVGFTQLYPAFCSVLADRTYVLYDLFVTPAARGTGAGRALTEHVLHWAFEHGYPTMITDWRMTNLLASRFWPKRGFRPTFLRLYRALP